MKYTITGTPVFHFDLSGYDVHRLSAHARGHYSRDCQGLVSRSGVDAEVNGILTIWTYHQRFGGESPLPPASRREVDLMLKALECPPPGYTPGPWTSGIRSLFLSALKLAGAQTWEVKSEGGIVV